MKTSAMTGLQLDAWHGTVNSVDRQIRGRLQDLNCGSIRPRPNGLAFARLQRSHMLEDLGILPMLRWILCHGMTNETVWKLGSEPQCDSPIVSHPAYADRRRQRR